ncbi:hypothetical protein ACQPZA_05995 [Pseudonocardia xinjiangensis]|uniref:hypothetical protein n=1 Tax=Pseudonocardia xinjiangensis TaxID=75289 RepID=UPI003D8D2857
MNRTLRCVLPEDSMVDTTLIQKGQLKPGQITTALKSPVNNAFYDPIRKVCDETKNKNCTSAS